MFVNQLLLEASDISVANLKKAISKDKRINLVLKKDSTFNDITNKSEFLTTLKYYVYNNKNVENFVKSRNNIDTLNSTFVTKFSSLTLQDFNETEFLKIKNDIHDLFKEYSKVSDNKISSDLKKKLSDWINSGDSRYHTLPAWAISELNSVPGLKPEKKVLLYRGVLFYEYDLKKRDSYDGTLELGNGLKFLKTIRKNGRTVDLTWEQPSSWTTSKEIAERFAKYGPAKDNFHATLKWLDRYANNRTIDGSLGYIISVLADPEDVLVDVAKLNNIGSVHGDEHEVILNPGTYLARIVKKYTVTGEADPEKSESDNTEIIKDAENLHDFIVKNITVGSEFKNIVDIHPGEYDAIRLFTHRDEWKELIKDSTTTVALHELQKVIDYYNNNLKDLNTTQIRAKNINLDDNISSKIEDLAKFIDSFNENEFFLSKKNRKSLSNITAEEFRDANDPYVKRIESDLILNGRVFDRNDGRDIDTLAHFMGVKNDIKSFAMAGVKKQQEVLIPTFKALVSSAGLTPSDRFSENVQTTFSLLKKAFKNYKVIMRLDKLYNIVVAK